MVKFVEISDADFQAWKERAIAEYFADRLKAGNDLPDSPGNSREEFESLLPYGRLTRNNYIFHIVDEDEGDRKVGIIWYAVDSRAFPSNSVFLYDIEVDREMRGRGYGTAALRLLEEKAKGLGKKRIALHVFAHNARARSLYEELGYRPTNIVMAKDV